MENLENFIVRLGEQRDLSGITEIYNWAVLNTVATFDLNPRTESEAQLWFELHQDPFYPLYVVENVVNNEIVGWGSLSPFHRRPAYKLSGEYSIYIDPEYHSRGIGGEVLRFLCEAAKQLEYHTILGLITSVNKTSIRLAERHGFEIVGNYHEVGRKFDKWLDVTIVQRMINSK